MKASVLRVDKRVSSSNDRSLGIQTFGDGNDYPQRLIEITSASGTANSCIRTYKKFIAGLGFQDADFYKRIVNRKGQTTDYLLQQVANDFSIFGGFALHVNYNGLGQVVEVQSVPFEHVRFSKLDDDGFFNSVKIHPDWGKRNEALRRFKKEDILEVNFFNPATVEREVEESGGWSSYKGQVYYFSLKGDRQYPIPVYDAVVTDMSTEEGIANVKNRNARNNFLAAGMLIDRRRKDQTTDQENETANELAKFQKDENALKIMYVEVESEDEIPEFKKFDTMNYDKEFDYSEKSVQQNIGRVFNQPPILRAENVGAGFGSELLANAYNFYNAITESERIDIERVFSAIFSISIFKSATDSYVIQPLRYASYA